jgi:hypothetical protein
VRDGVEEIMRSTIVCLLLLGVALPVCAQGRPKNVIQWLIENKCKQVNSDRRHKLLGSLVERDDVDGEDFGFVICQRWSLVTGEWDVIIQSNRAVGAGLTSEEGSRKAARAAAAGQTYVKFGLPFNPLGKLDARRVEYRLYHKGGRPAALEIFVQMRDARRNAKKPAVLKVPWPARPI